MRKRTEDVVIDRRFRGPPRSANGGYSCGIIARHLDGAVAVRLSAPPPLDTALRLESSPDEARLFHGDALVGTARRADLPLDPPTAPSYAEAEQASHGYVGFSGHPFPTCFVCGPERASGDGLRIFAGPVAERELVAAPWTPDPSLTDDRGTIGTEFIWSALDCSSAFAVLPDSREVTIVLGELVARVSGTVTAGERYVVVGWRIGIEGRKRFAGSAVYTAQGDPIAVARATWIEVPAAAFADA
jgi:hypothetical protein